MTNHRKPKDSRTASPEAEAAPTNVAQPVRTVTGHRLLNKAEKFVVRDDAPDNDETSEMLSCPECRVVSAAEEWAKADDACPSCGWSAEPEGDNVVLDDEPVLSEAELFLQSVRDDDSNSYQIKVDHLVNYFDDGRTDTRAVRRFCFTTRDVGFNLLDVVQRRCPHLKAGEEGAFSFDCHQLTGADRGFRKRWWELVTKPLEAETLPVAQTPPQQQQYAPPPPPQKSAREELREVLDLAKEIVNVRGNNQPQQQALPPQPPPDPMEAMDKSFSMFTRMGDMFRSVTPAGGDHNWVDSTANLIDKLRVGDLILNVGQLVAQAVIQNRAAAAAAARNGGTAEATQAQPASPPAGHTSAPPAALAGATGSSVGENAPNSDTPNAPPPEAAAQISSIEAALNDALAVVVEELILDTDDSDGVAHRETAAQALHGFVQANPIAASVFDQVMAQSSADLVKMLSEQRPEWSLIAKLGHAQLFISDVKGRVEELQEEQGTGGAELIEFPNLETAAIEETRVEVPGNGRTGKAGGAGSARAEADTPQK